MIVEANKLPQMDDRGADHDTGHPFDDTRRLRPAEPSSPTSFAASAAGTARGV
ncbi:hypothetical protein RVR_513 [Actinacidiphila reveromycinica]|uniref:Uncharacterized protein n=1 Tax=Actinacidiphila reveromycinica TaxID=659352 RepID=A0A7U3WGX2_9ACTN|nr:hypothetical protein [Streptomyces sp. SN-593]BBA95595.1 hypothetical protein RVR_513 [Streptomyces sp. SN-593]